MPASGHQNHTTSPSASVLFVKSTICVHRIPPRVRDDREPPLWGDETARVIVLIWVRREWKCFYKRDWTGQITLIRMKKFGCARISVMAGLCPTAVRFDFCGQGAWR